MPFDVERLRREEFPWAAAGEAVYLDAASTGPLPERTVSAQQDFTRKRAAPHRLTHEEQFGVLADARLRLASLIGADVGNIALAANTGAGINLAAWGLPLGPGDMVVVPDLEFPANVYPWIVASAARGFTLHRVAQPSGVLDEETLLAALDLPGVKLLSLSWVGFATGAVANLARLGAACRARGIWFVVDGIQGVGALTLDVASTGVDLLACGGQKWLLSPWGTGFTFVAKSLLETLTPQPVSWMGMQASSDFSSLLDYDPTWRDDARRFEQVTLPYQDFAGMAASLELLHTLGHGAVVSHIAALVDKLVEGAERAGLHVITPPGRRAGIVTLQPSDVAGSSARLRDATVVHSVREGTIRLAPHCYSTSAEIELVLHILNR